VKPRGNFLRSQSVCPIADGEGSDPTFKMERAMAATTYDGKQFQVGSVVALVTESGDHKVSGLLPGDDLTMQSATSGTLRGRVTVVTPETIGLSSNKTEYALSPAAATLGASGVYEGAWVIRSSKHH
jgi:hypothetical protein